MLLFKLISSRNIAKLLTVGLTMLGVLSINVKPHPAHASEGVFILSQNVSCDRVDVTYDVVVAFPTDTTTLRVFSGGTQIASISGIATTDGNHSASIPLNPAQPIGTVLHAEVEVNDGIGFSVTDTGSPTPCYENSNNGGSGNNTGSSGETPPPIWDGFRDGRLNPEMAEYYTVYCRNDVAEVYRANPPPTRNISQISILTLLRMDFEGEQFVQDGITVARDQNRIVLSGTNGNLAPEYGTKDFDLGDCINYNGGTPDNRVPDANPPNSDDRCLVSENLPTFSIEPGNIIAPNEKPYAGQYFLETNNTGSMVVVFDNPNLPVLLDLTRQGSLQARFDVSDSNECLATDVNGDCRRIRISAHSIGITLKVPTPADDYDIVTGRSRIRVTATTDLECQVQHSFAVDVVNPSEYNNAVYYMLSFLVEFCGSGITGVAGVMAIPMILFRRKRS